MHTKFETAKQTAREAPRSYPFPSGSSLGEERQSVSQLSSPASGPSGAYVPASGPIASQSPSQSGQSGQSTLPDTYETKRSRKPSYIRASSYERYRPSKSSPLASPTLEAVEAAERESVEANASAHSLTRTLTRDGSLRSLVRPRLYQQVSEGNPNGRLVLVRSISRESVDNLISRPRAPTPERASRIFESLLDSEPREESGVGIRPPKRLGFFGRLKQRWLDIRTQTFNRNG